MGDADSIITAAAKLRSLQSLYIRNTTVLNSDAWCPSLRRSVFGYHGLDLLFVLCLLPVVRSCVVSRCYI